jgi:hypothetical protein
MDTTLVKQLSVKSAALAFVVLAASLCIVPNPARSEEHAKGPASTHELLMKAHEQLEMALHSADLAVAPHQPGVGWHKAHTQRAINVVVGTGNPDFNKEVENPGDGHGVMKYLTPDGAQVDGIIRDGAGSASCRGPCSSRV